VSTPLASQVAAAIDAYVHGGPGNGRAVRANQDAWDSIPLYPRVMRDLTSADASIELLGLSSPVPVLAAPWAKHRLLHPEGELATARGLADCGIPMIQSSSSTVPVDRVAAVAGPFWQQVYVPQDRSAIDGFLARAREAGARALVLTVDHPSAGNRLPFRAPLAELSRSGAEDPALDSLRAATGHANFPDLPPGTPLGSAADLGPADVTTLAGRSGLPVVVKGVLRADDARAAVDAGAAAVIVSNHGGRHLAGTVTTAQALPAVAAAVGDEVPVLVDGGIRNGEDVVRALALGARAVLVGRPVARALADGPHGDGPRAVGPRGVRGEEDAEAQRGGAEAVGHWGRSLIDDVRRTLELCGVARPAEVGPDLVGGPPID
jgi:4-hydroxymandelate oxidase